MVSNPADARLRHLEKASRCLLVSSPAISGYLQLEQDATSDELDGVDLKGSDRSCSACGNILIVGWSCERVRPARKTHSKAKGQYRGRLRGLCQLRCSKCHAIITIGAEQVQQRSKGPKSERNTPDLNKSIKSSTSTTVPPPEAKDIKTFNRRFRGKKPTLQSMLADQKKAEMERPKGFGLDLTDLMQS